MLDEQLLGLITATGEMLDLEDPVIEKDYYVTQVIHALSAVENDYFRLVFCGGTCLAKAIVSNDAKQFKNQHPEYSVDPAAEIQRSLALLKNKPLWKERYQKFIEEMVYDSTPALEYEQAITVLEQISAGVIDSLSQ